MKKLFFVSSLFSLLLFSVAPGMAAGSPIQIYVSILPQKYFVERIGGERVQVAVMVGPGKSPATYDPTPKQMEDLNAARLFFSIGVPFEKIWMKRLTANHPDLRVIDSIEGVRLLPMVAHSHEEEEHGHGHHEKSHHEEDHGMLDPHVWTSPPPGENHRREYPESPDSGKPLS